MKVMRSIREVNSDESGQDLLEYALVLATVIVAVVAGSGSIASTLASGLGHITARIQSTIG